ncbi:type IV secretory system conjugative DNA transfer family protein [Oscillochloris sp. ZM17-4]|uniref:type IV secretory system conjugative DNA transfer family protein n=1 Tax=Oscillochloris sp. ZM17-4 TaxID=2866714 RepID=UPI001C72B371|nr:type IV secretory system conjugative DNA transfer family protein [Oscillochloris sp. ZM17-4]MBX0331172.1 type IV secretory system conjugative DNA transfer family protein [Oscillochloris sp. ZM17-4]
MTLITAEELARGLLIGTFGGLAGLCTVSMPGSALWLLPAGLAAGGCALTMPEVRAEAARALPAPLVEPVRGYLAEAAQGARGLFWHLPGVRREGRPALAGPPAAGRSSQAAPAQAEGSDLVETLEGTPHRLIIGHTRGGKTTLIHHMATAWAAAGERVLVGDPDAAPGLWPGCEVRGAGDDVASIGELLGVVQAEVAARRAQRAQGVRSFAPLHIVIDEAQDVLPVVSGGLELFEDVARRGGKLNIRMTVGVQDKQVKTLGLEGKSELLRNFQVADVLKNREGRRVAVLRDAETGDKVIMPIPQLLDPESLITVASRPAPAAPAAPAAPLAPVSAPDPLLAELLRRELLASMSPERAARLRAVSSASGRQDTPAPVSVSVSHAADTDTDTDTATGGVSVRLGGDGGHLTVNVNARAETAAPAGRGRPRRGRGLDMRRRRQQAQSAQGDTHKAELQVAYADRKAQGLSYRKAYAELGGSSAEARAWWGAAPSPKAQGVTP